MIFHKPDIVDHLLSEGVELKQKGRNFWASCPLHSERTPSFKVDSGRQQFYCFGCNSGGDIITFVQKFHSLSYSDALTYLGINKKPFRPTAKYLLKQSKQKRLQQLRQKYSTWKNSCISFLADVLRNIDMAKTNARTIEKVESISWLYHQESLWQYHFDILAGTDEEVKFNLFKDGVHV